MTSSTPQHPNAPRLELIVAVAENGVIGRDNDLPWRLPDDLRHFKRITTGHTVIMGRNTWTSIGRALPNRANIVVSSRLTRDNLPPAVGLAKTLDEALARSTGPVAFVIGGAGLLAEALERADAVHLTRVHADVAGDVVLTGLDALREPAWTQAAAEPHAADAEHAYAFTIERWVRTPA